MKLKNIKSFEAYSINEEGKFRNFFKGHEDDADRDNKRDKILADLDKYEKMAEKDPDKYVFNRETLENQAKENDFLGEIWLNSNAYERTGKIWVQYEKGYSSFSKMAGAAGRATRTMGRKNESINHKITNKRRNKGK